MNSPILGEFIGTFVLLLFGTGVGCAVNLNKTLAKAVGIDWVLVAFGWGTAVMLGVFTSGFFGAPGHLNPAVTISFALGGIFDWGLVVPFVIVQLLGAALGAAVASLHYWPHFKATTPEEGNTVGVFATGAAIHSPIYNLISEIIATFAFVFTIMLLPSGDIPVGVQPLILVFLLTGISFSFGSTTGYAINPARDLGPRFIYSVLPIPNKGTSNWGYAWIPTVGPIIGAVIAVFIVNALS